MKKNFILKISFILILAMMFSVFSMNVMAAISVRDNLVPLDAGVFLFADDDTDETPVANPKTSDNMLLFNILTIISLTALSTSVGVIKKLRAK